MKILLMICLLSLRVLGIAQVKNYAFFNRERERIYRSEFLDSNAFVGAQLKYTWAEIEPEKDNYNFEFIENDLDHLLLNGKELFIQIQDVSFDTTVVNVPTYLLEDQLYNGGVEVQVEMNDEETTYNVIGLVSRRWDKEVQARFHKLVRALGKQFDGRIEGINLPETIIGFGTADMFPKGYTDEKYKNAVKSNMLALKESFPKSVAITYANFMPGDPFPLGEKSYLEEVFDYAVNIGAGIGGPDIKVNKWYQMQHGYKFMNKLQDRLTLGVAVQWGNYDEINRKTERQVTVDEIYLFGKDYLGLDYIFWGTQEPYFTRDVIPFLRNR